MSRNDVFGPLGTRLVMNAGAIATINPQPGQNSVSIKLISGGTLEIGGYSEGLKANSIGFSAAGATIALNGGQTFGSMYPLSAGEIYNANLSGKIYLYASDATCVVSLVFGRSAGF